MTIAAKVTGATKCVLSVSPKLKGYPVALPCGDLLYKANLPADPTSKTATYRFTLAASGASSTSRRSVVVRVSAEPAPSIGTLAVTPGTLTDAGGTVHLSAQVVDATTCTLYVTPSLPGLPRSVGCASTNVTISLPANATTVSQSYAFRLRAGGVNGVTSRTITATVAAALTPDVTSFVASPATLSTAGGATTISASVANATHCTLSSSPPIPGLQSSVSCSGIAASVHLPANPGATPTFYTFTLAATGNSTVTATTMAVVVAHGAPPAVLDVSGTLSGNTEWSPGLAGTYDIVGQLDIPAGVTLTIAPGTVIKSYGGDYACTDSYGALCVDGSLDAIGTVPAPITFTSINDNSVGGATGTGTPEAGEWTGIGINETGTIDLSHAVVNYAIDGVNGDPSALNAVTITSNVLDHISESAVSLEGTRSPVITNNTSGGAGSYSYSVLSSGLNFSELTGNTATAGTPSGFEIGGNAVTSTMGDASIPWLLYGTQLDIPAGVTLTIAPGTVIKSYGGDYACTDSYGALCVDGSLDAIGTVPAPITFTSINDNSVGGATGTGTPEAGEWTGIGINETGTIDLSHAVVNYAIDGVNGDPSALNAVTITSNVLDHISESAVSLEGTRSPVITNNTSGGAGSYSYSVLSSGLNFSELTGNTATAGTPSGFEIGGNAVTSTMGDASIPWLLYGTQLDIPAGVTLTIAPGTVIKSYGGDYACTDSYGALCVDGSLDAIGTVPAPITFTSINDNSVGGATGTGTPEAGEWTGIGINETGTIDLSHAVVNYAIDGVNGDPSALNAVTITSNVLDHISESAVSLEGTRSPVITNNTSGGAGSYSYSVLSSGLNFSELTGNTATAGTPSGFEIGGNAVTSTMGDASIPWLLYGTQLDIPAGVTLTIAPGTVIKSYGGDYACTDSYGALCVDGSLDAIGTVPAPITFTSINDNSVGGATGTGTPEAGEWTGIGINDGGQLNAVDATLDYAVTALYVTTTGVASITGAILNALTGVKAFGPVDATDVNWGSASGPFPIGTGSVVEGSDVLVSPWVGEAPQVMATPLAAAPGGSFHCSSSDVEFIGANASGEATTSLDTELKGVETGYAADVSGTTVASVSLDYPAAPVSDLWFGSTTYMGSVNEGVDNLLGLLEATQSQCPGEPVVLAGYAQGALVVHLTLNYLASVHSTLLSSSILRAVILVSDPAKYASQGDTVWLADKTTAGAGVVAANGVWAEASEGGELTGATSSALDASLGGRTIEICHDRDLVCAPGLFLATPPQAGELTHTSYSPAEMHDMGAWAAELK